MCMMVYSTNGGRLDFDACSCWWRAKATTDSDSSFIIVINETFEFCLLLDLKQTDTEAAIFVKANGCIFVLYSRVSLNISAKGEMISGSVRETSIFSTARRGDTHVTSCNSATLKVFQASSFAMSPQLNKKAITSGTRLESLYLLQLNRIVQNFCTYATPVSGSLSKSWSMLLDTKTSKPG